MEQIANGLASTSELILSNSANICQKLDGLIDAIKYKNTSSTPPPSIDGVLKHRKTLVEKIVRHELLLNYYNELINEEKPFARKALRTKVNKNASQIDLRHRQLQTIDNVKREILIMQDRLIEFQKKKQLLEENLDSLLKSDETAHAWITDRIAEDDREAKVSYEKKLSMMKKTDLKEKRTVTNYLLKFKGASPKPAQDQQNSRNSSQRWFRRPWKNRNGDE